MADTQSGPYAHYLKETRQLIDAIGSDVGVGSFTDAYQNMLYGLNHRGLSNPVPSNQDNVGMIFFTKPDMNLSYDNLTKARELMPLAVKNDEPPTLQRAVRLLLDPRKHKEGLASGLVNERSPFIHLLSNTLLTLSGWPDIAPETFTSREGVMREQWSLFTGHSRHLGEFDLTAAFKNTQGNPILLLMLAWITYMSGVRYRDMEPYTDNIVNLRKDYETRIYHFTMDPSRRFIQMSAVANAAFPYTVPIGNAFNFNGQESFNQSNGQIPVSFKCQIAEYNDPINLREFNTTVAKANPDLAIVQELPGGELLTKGEAAGRYVKLPQDFLKQANYKGTPVINTYTGRMYWYVTKEEYINLGGS